jgi:hypothetical protein
MSEFGAEVPRRSLNFTRHVKRTRYGHHSLHLQQQTTEEASSIQFYCRIVEKPVYLDYKMPRKKRSNDGFEIGPRCSRCSA